MTQLRVLLACGLTLGMLLGCVWKPPEVTPDGHAAVERISHYGHGKLFDEAMKEIVLDDRVLLLMQKSMLGDIQNDKGENASPADKAAMAVARELLSSGKLARNEIAVLNSGLILTGLRTASPALREKLAWRNQVLFYHYWNEDLTRRVLSEAVRDLIGRLHLFEPVNAGTPSAYMNDCRAHNVPIPPDWAESGTAWRKQGTLSTNLLAPGGYAEVWTYSDPTVRGACVALPRDSGAVGTLAGIICQSATTGHACFWDNQLRSAPANVLGWSGKRLVISELVDGATMADGKRCTGCHRGNNVYLLSPDDPTWAKTLRGPMVGGSTGTFTTRVEASSDNTGGHPRYIPVTTVPPRSGWDNPFSAAANCAGACHEKPTLFAAPAMPPACASPSVANCYGTP
jgi:hypothetical protein